MKRKYDLAVIGGGPAGIMAATIAARNGKRVVIIERNPSLGIKLLITGKGRCNITNNTQDNKELIKAYGNNGKFLHSAFFAFDVSDTLDFFHKLGVETKVERGDRVFPVSDKSMDVLQALKKDLNRNNVELKLNTRVKEIKVKNKKIEKIIFYDSSTLIADNYLIATGGKSYKATGSSGDGYAFLEKMGHTIVKPRPALSPIVCEESFIKELEGLSLKNVSIRILQNNKEKASEFGEALFTANGMSGPIILNLSNSIDDPVEEYKLKIDFKPALSLEEMDKRLQNDFKKYNNKQFKNALDDLLPKKLIPIFIRLSKIDPAKQTNSVSKEERKRLLGLFKNFELNIQNIVGYEKAIVTKGGVDIKEINPKTMKSKIIDNLYVAGEVLDIDGPTGGYNLQICWSSGFVVGTSI